MTRYKAWVDFSSDRDKETLEAFLVRSLEHTGAKMHYITMKGMEHAGRPPRLKRAVEDFIATRLPGEEIVLEEVAEAVNFSYTGVRRAAKKLAEEGKLVGGYDTKLRVVVYHIPQ